MFFWQITFAVSNRFPPNLVLITYVFVKSIAVGWEKFSNNFVIYFSLAINFRISKIDSLQVWQGYYPNKIDYFKQMFRQFAPYWIKLTFSLTISTV